MKITFVFIVLSCFAAVSLGARKCTQQSDCEEDECCLDTLFFRSAFCEPRYAAVASSVSTVPLGRKVSGSDRPVKVAIGKYKSVECDFNNDVFLHGIRNDERNPV